MLCRHRDIVIWCDWLFSWCCVRIVTSPFGVTDPFLAVVYASLHRLSLWLVLFLVLCTHRYIAFWCDWPFSCCCVRIVTSPFVVTGSFLGVVYALLHRRLVWLVLFLVMCTHRYIAVWCDLSLPLLSIRIKMECIFRPDVVNNDSFKVKTMYKYIYVKSLRGKHSTITIHLAFIFEIL